MYPLFQPTTWTQAKPNSSDTFSENRDDGKSKTRLQKLESHYRKQNHARETQ
jgi:hypothetical protein